MILETEIAKAEAKELIYEQAKSETTAKLLPGNGQEKKSISFLQPLTTLHEDLLIQEEGAAVKDKPDLLSSHAG